MDGGAESIHDKNNMSRDDKYRCNAFTSDTKLSEVVFQLHLCVSVSESDYWIVSSRITHAYTAMITIFSFTDRQGVVTATPALLTPATAIKILLALFSDLDRFP